MNQNADDNPPVPKSLDLTDSEVRRALLNTETAKIPWRELQRYFAAGAAIAVAAELDLLSVGAEVMADNKVQMEGWISSGKVAPVSDLQAAEWYDANALMWAVVLSPWVFVQPILQNQQS
ncbi:MAG: DUF2288 domain-containing protein [Porticoccaceae bacterium]|nr:DUF2288 domain-containing protein [Porticoccaceae bacterium]